MKKQLRLGLSIVIAASLVCTAILINSSALYNDVTFESYTNMAQDSAIPSLFRNDSVFPQYKQHPPVITDGLEYVPLEVFYGLSGVKISFSDDGTNFYIQNKNTNKYISFSVGGEYAVTGTGNVYEAKIHTFYDIHYVPLRLVCSTTGIGCDSYNDGINKIYVIKVYTAPGLSAQELIRIHAPSVYDVPSEEDTPPAPPPPPPIVNPDEDKEQPPVDKPKPEVFPPRTLYFFFDGSLESATDTLDTLRNNGVAALVFVTEQDMLTYPDTVRRIITDGNTVGVKIDAEPSEICKADGLESLCRSAMDTLYEVTKTKSRIITLPEDSEGLYGDADIYARAEELGLRTVFPNVDGKTDTLSAYAATQGITAAVKNLERTHHTRSALIRLTHTSAGRGAIANLVSFSAANPAVNIALFDEVTD